VKNLISQILFTIIILQSFLIIHLYLQPYKYAKINYLDTIAYVSEICGCTYVAWHLSAYQPGDVTTVKEAQAVQSALQTDFYAFSCLAVASVILYILVLMYFVADGLGFCRCFEPRKKQKIETAEERAARRKRNSSHKFHLKDLKAPFDDGEVHQFRTAELVKIRGGKKIYIGSDGREVLIDLDKRFVDKNDNVIAVGDVVSTMNDSREGLITKTFIRDSMPFADVTYMNEVARKYEHNDALRGKKLNPLTLLTEREVIERPKSLISDSSSPDRQINDSFQNLNPLFLRKAAPDAVQLAVSKDYETALDEKKRIVDKETRHLHNLELLLRRTVIEESHHEVSDDEDEDTDYYPNGHNDEVRNRNSQDDEEEDRDRAQRSSFQPKAWSGWALTGGLF
jgi:hypothetical protein